VSNGHAADPLIPASRSGTDIPQGPTSDKAGTARLEVTDEQCLVIVSENKPQPRYELARQVVVGFAAGLAAGYAGPLPGAVAAGAAPLVQAGMDYISATIGSRRLDHATETLTDGADEFGARTPKEFVEFVKAAVSDEEHQELLARALTIAQDTAMRDKDVPSAGRWQLQRATQAWRSMTSCYSSVS
jgi:hypothetical protein